MSKFFRIVAFAAFLLAPLGAFAQSVEVSGIVTDAGEPMIGATVMVKNSQNAAITDIDGKYSLKVNVGDVLVFSFIGYKTEERTVAGADVISVEMKPDVDVLETVVVLGYGAQAKRSDLSASVGVVATPEKLAQRPVTSAASMLQGQIPGVTISNDGGSPTSDPKVVIRGQGSQNNESVLWVVDGIPGAPINSVNDIESMVVLKDAASAAIYGASSGAGGVVLVTTKKGQKGISVSYDGLVGVRQAAKMITPLTAEQQIEVNQKAYANAGLALPEGWDVTKNPYIATTRTNWMEEIFRTALYHRHNVVLNGGTDKLKNRVSFSVDNNDGVLVGTYNNKMGVNYKGDFQINQWIKLSEDLTWTNQDSKDANTDGATSGAIVEALQMPSSASTTFWTGEGYGGTTTEDPAYIAKYGSNYAGIHGITRNPLRQLTADDVYNKTNKFFTTTSLEVGNIDQVKGLKFVSRFTYYTNQQLYKRFTPKITECGSKDLSNSLYYSTYKDEGWKTENTLTFDRTFGKHSVGALLSTTADGYNSRSVNLTEKGFNDESIYLHYLKYGDPSTLTGGDSYTGDDANLAIIARLSYSYNDRYFVTASWRRDYAGRLPSNHNYGDFPAITAAWKISSESFFPKTDAVSLLKLRTSWGRIGNLGSIGMNYKSNTLTSSSEAYAPIYGPTVAGSQYGNVVYNNKALNPNLTWETSEQTNVGIDAGFLRDRLLFTVEFYNKRTYNLIQNQTMNWPNSIGVDAMKVNLGEVTNRGVEFQLGWQETRGHWTYNINGNGAYNKNWVSDIGVTDADGNPSVWSSSTQYRDIYFYQQTCQGGPIGQYYMIKSLGIFQSDTEAQEYKDADGNMIQPNAKAGDLKFEDYNGDGKIDINDRQYLGNSTPEFTYAFNAGFSWRGLGFNMMWQGAEGAQAVNAGKMATLSMSSKVHNRSNEIYNAWSPENTGSNIPRLSALDPNGNFTTASSWYLEDASYLRLKNVTLSYDFTDLIRKAKHLNERNSSLMIYFSGENLLTITKYSGLDPECGTYDFLKYPVSRVLSFGIKLTY